MIDKIELVPYTDNDYEFVYEVKKNAYKKYVEECWGSWLEEDQRNYFKNFITNYKNSILIIMYNEKKIGFYNGEVLESGNYEIGNICIIPEYQGKGIGTKILKEKLKENKNRNIEIQYFKQNPVGKLYERLGFIPNGETKFHYQMIKIKYSCSNCLSIQFDLLKGMFFDNKEETDNYILCTSSVINNYYWNLAYLKNKIDNSVILEIENKLRKLNRVPCLYIGRDDTYYIDNKKLIISNGYSLKDTDVFMILGNYKNVDNNINIKVVKTENEYNDFMKVLSSAYNDSIENVEENVYADIVTECYYEAVKTSIGNGKTYHIIGYDKDIPVSVATLSIHNNVGVINNVGTMQGNWNKGYSKQVLGYLIHLFKEKGGKDLILCTEYHSKNQSYYEKIGFKEIYVMEQYVK